MRTSRVGSRTFPLTQRYLAVTSANIQTRITPFPLLVPRQTSPTPSDYKKVTPKITIANLVATCNFSALACWLQQVLTGMALGGRPNAFMKQVL